MSRKRVYGGVRPAVKRRKPTIARDLRLLKARVNRQRNVGFLDTQIVDEVDTTGLVSCLNLIAEGTDDNERLGNKINMIGLEYCISIVPETSNTTWGHCSVYIVYDKQPNGALATPANIVESLTSPTFPKWGDKDRFTILRKFQCESARFANADANSSNQWYGYIKLNKKTNYDAATATIGSINSGALLCLFVGSLTAATNSTKDARCNFRLTFDQ